LLFMNILNLHILYYCLLTHALLAIVAAFHKHTLDGSTVAAHVDVPPRSRGAGRAVAPRRSNYG